MLSAQYPARRGFPPLLHGLDSILVERCPDLLVVLDSEHKVVLSSAGLRAAVALVEAGMEFAHPLGGPPPARFAPAPGRGRAPTAALSPAPAPPARGPLRSPPDCLSP